MVTLHHGFFAGGGKSLPARRLRIGSCLVSVVSIDNDGNMTGYASDADYINYYPFLLEPLGDGAGDRAPERGELHGCKLPRFVQQRFAKRQLHKNFGP